MARDSRGFPRKAAIGAILLFAITLDGVSHAQNANLRQGKEATAYVDLGGNGSATAFCIDAAGYFVTNEHVTRSVGTGKIRLILNPSETNQRIVEVTVIRQDAAADLAVLKTTTSGPFAALQLGRAEGLAETISLTAFGYPFGKAIAAVRNEYPAVTVSVGRITALRKVKGELNEIQLDASLNPGNSGGPVVDGRGAVIGIVQGGVPGAALNFAIPVEKLRALLSKPVISFTPPTVPFAKRNDPQEFVVELRTFNQSTTTYTVELSLANNAEVRTIRLLPAGDNYVTSAPLIEARPLPPSVRVTLTFANGVLSGEIADRDVKIGDRTTKISKILRIERESTTRITLDNGESLTARIEGLEMVPVDFGGARANIDMTAARRIEIAPAAPPERQVAYTVTVRKGTETIQELKGSIALAGAPSPFAAISAMTSTGNGSRIAALPLSPSPLATDRVSLKLPGPADNVIVAGGGRYLIFEIRRLRQLAVFDVNAAKFTNFLAMPSDNVRIAAGMDRLLVLLPDMNQLQRWSLRTMEREVTVSLDVSDASAVAMGYASAGPLLALTAKGPVFFDVDTLKPIEVKSRAGSNSGFGGNWTGKMEVRASADGTTFAAWATGSSPTGIRLLRLDGTAMTTFYEHSSAGTLLPSQDGSFLFTGSGGIYSADLKPISREQFGSVQAAPSLSPAYFIGIKRENTLPTRSQTGPPSLNVYSFADRRLLLTLQDLDELVSTTRPPTATVVLEKRAFLIPQAELLVTLPETRDELILRRVNLMTEMEKSGLDYLFVASLPLRSAQKDQLYQYEIDVKSKRGEVAYKLESGPSGMRVSPSGLMTWTVPAAADPQAPVIVSIRDASGQEVYHSFTITVR